MKAKSSRLGMELSNSKLVRASNLHFMLYFLINKVMPKILWRRYVQSCSNLEESIFILSFDCDTELDIEVLPGVIKQLRDIGIQPVLAVPGELIKKGADLYLSLAKAGIEFMNHGYVQHTQLELPERIYVSNFFYHSLTRTEIRNDIILGHKSIQEILGVIPIGFRTPHFGSFQKKSQLKFLWKLLKELGYGYSTSTTPVVGIQKGPYFKTDVLEFPVTGCPSWPIKVLDSWGFAFAPSREVTKADYLDQISLMYKEIKDGHNLLINIYADPSQVYDWPEFFEALQKLAPYNVGRYSEIMDTVGR